MFAYHIANTVPNRQKSSKIDKNPGFVKNPGQKLLGRLKPVLKPLDQFVI